DDDNLLVNEIAPRPHNSGHITLDTHTYNQFELLIRSITGLPFLKNTTNSSGYMKNIIGKEINDIHNFSIPNKQAKTYIYGKNLAKNGRKMGHINFIKSHERL
ncbi:ATP-grasp domain-containing protein, partial [Flavobacteriaceae bacterium]|nr:ATP-grasp domain-containing protein [Flavobacteriaceae bacterium]